MGNRSVIQIATEGSTPQITLYGHWAGDSNLTAVRNVLERTDRLGDVAYLTAQLFYEFAVNLGGYNGGLGFGIHTGELTEDENPIVIVNADTGEYFYDGERYTEYAQFPKVVLA